MQKTWSFNDLVIVFVKRNDYRILCGVWVRIKSAYVKESSGLNKKWIIIKFKNILSHVKDE